MTEPKKYHDDSLKKNEEDIVWIQSFLQGDDNAFSHIYHKYVDELFIYGTALGFDRETLKDAIQDTFYKFYIHRKHLKDVRHLKYYLFRMLKNRLLDICKSPKNEVEIEINEISFYMDASILDEIILREEKEYLRNRVNQLLEILTDRQREAVYLRFIQEMEYDEVAGLLDMTPPAVRKLVTRAIKRMREK